MPTAAGGLLVGFWKSGFYLLLVTTIPALLNSPWALALLAFGLNRDLWADADSCSPCERD